MDQRDDKLKLERKENDDKMKQNLKDFMSTELGDIKKELGNITQEIQKNTEKIQKVEELTKELGKKSQELAMADERLEIMIEAKAMDKQVRLRGLSEEKGRNLYKKMAAIFAEFMDDQGDAFEDELDLAYRVNSSFAEKKKLPRYIIVQFVTSRTKEEFLWNKYKTPLEIDGKRILILKEIPRKALALRKKYHKLVDTLTKHNIKFRWDLPEGITFQYKGTRQTIRSEDQMEAFLGAHKVDFSK